MDNPEIRRSNFISTYYSGKEAPADRRAAVQPRRNRAFDKRLWLNAIFLLGLVSGLAAAIISFLGIKARPLDIGMPATSALSSGKDYNSIAYYNYRQVENIQQPVMLEPKRSCAAINFDMATDLTGGALSFNAKGGDGTEKVAIVLRDARRMSNANQNDIILTPVLPDGQWQRFNIELKDLTLPLDKSRITQVRFDLSAKFTKNRPQAIAYIKEITIK